MQSLKGKVAVVTGASRGAGRGIALVLGEAGATVYVTGRSTRSGETTQNRPETIEETAEMVTARGGVGIPVRCDHKNDADVKTLFEQVEREQGRLDILVNNAWSGYEEMAQFGAKFWEQPLWRWDAMITGGARAHFVASHFAAPLMIKTGKGGLVVNTSFYDRGVKIGSVIYDTAKAAINRVAFGMGAELKEHGITAVALSPGWMRTEKVHEEMKTDETTWQSVESMQRTESVEYIGRAVLALACDPHAVEKAGQTLCVGDLAREYGFTDTDGRQPPAFRLDH